jgi:hypothetical protein
MAVTFTGDDRFPAALTAARSAAGGEIGTVHLLAGMIDTVPMIGDLFDTFDVTPPVLRAVAAHVPVADGDAPDVSAVVRGHENLTFTATVRAALTRSAAYHPGPCPPERLLDVVLGDRQAGAVTLLDACGAEVDRLRQALRTGLIPGYDDRLAPALRPIRDKLIGRQPYRARGLRGLLRSAFLPGRVDYAAVPVTWASLEAGDVAKRRGGPTRTDDVLLAMLTTHEVAAAYPHLVGDGWPQYAGTRSLLAAGFDHDRLAAVAAADPGEDAVPLKNLLKAGPGWPQNTAALLRALTAHPGTRASRVLHAAGLDPVQSTVEPAVFRRLVTSSAAQRLAA